MKQTLSEKKESRINPNYNFYYEEDVKQTFKEILEESILIQDKDGQWHDVIYKDKIKQKTGELE